MFVKTVNYRLIDLFVLMLLVAIISLAYARPSVVCWMAQPGTGATFTVALNGQYREYGVFATFLTTGTTPGSVAGESFRLYPLSLAIELTCVLVILLLAICLVRLFRFYRDRKLEIREIDLLIQNGPGDTFKQQLKRMSISASFLERKAIATRVLIGAT
jgi:hypothetical protein